mmetsp:Transcript_19149/g.39464  ORF Transcript_19149/g.39464 Transcript_19149/m.39464 type:complete len:272 (+) Transcript_19149:1075-1890(+)
MQVVVDRYGLIELTVARCHDGDMEGDAKGGAAEPDVFHTLGRKELAAGTDRDNTVLHHGDVPHAPVARRGVYAYLQDPPLNRPQVGPVGGSNDHEGGSEGGEIIDGREVHVDHPPLLEHHCLRHDLGGVRLALQPRRSLAEVVNLCYGRLALQGVRNAVHVDVALVTEVHESVLRRHRLPPPLLVAEDEVDPRVQMLANVLALEREAVDPYEFVRAAFRPRGQNHVIDLAPVVLKRSEGELVGVQEDLGDAEHLRHHLLEVSRVRLATLPR